MRSSGGDLLDTSVVIRATRRFEAEAGALDGIAGCFLSAITWGELRVGVQLSPDPTRELGRLRAVRLVVDVLPVTEITAARYGEVFHHLKGRGTPIPTNDIWIAATALQHGLPLRTGDRHFSRVEGLEVVLI